MARKASSNTESTAILGFEASAMRDSTFSNAEPNRRDDDHA